MRYTDRRSRHPYGAVCPVDAVPFPAAAGAIRCSSPFCTAKEKPACWLAEECRSIRFSYDTLPAAAVWLILIRTKSASSYYNMKNAFFRVPLGPRTCTQLGYGKSGRSIQKAASIYKRHLPPQIVPAEAKKYGTSVLFDRSGLITFKCPFTI